MKLKRTSDGHGFYVYSDAWQFKGWAPTEALARECFTPRVPVLTGERASWTRACYFGVWRDAWRLKDGHTITTNGSGAAKIKDNLYLDLKNGKLFRYETPPIEFEICD